MSKIKRASILLFRIALTFIAMLVAYILSTMVIGETNVIMKPEVGSLVGSGLNVCGAAILAPWIVPQSIYACHGGAVTFL